MVHKWINKPNGHVEDHWIDLITQDTENGMDEDHWREASVRSDGCVHYHRFHNSPGPREDGKDTDYFHICDIDEEIEWLKALKAAALEHFGEWPR